ncbi:6621_t:CDS:2 [Scutellospora calospora]|uniref:6621_t:CDS:1 n=1 Tax=Scutellospora calospora TaxID=85575 RepID=A0ACA9KI77_9GLOM|nr:6621_t:CDS:2 [Scutellospora calospora]
MHGTLQNFNSHSRAGPLKIELSGVHIRYYNHSDFTDLIKIGESGNVYQAKWTDYLEKITYNEDNSDKHKMIYDLNLHSASRICQKNGQEFQESTFGIGQSVV